MNENDIMTPGVGQCGICGAVAHYMKWGSYECADNEYHVANKVMTNKSVGDKPMVWQDLSHPKNFEGLVYKTKWPVKYAGMPGKEWDGLKQKFVKIASDLHVGEITSIPSKIDVGALVKAINEKWVFQPKYNGAVMKNPCLEVQLPLPVKEVKVTMAVKPKEFPMPLLNPKSEWGRRMKEKLSKKG